MYCVYIHIEKRGSTSAQCVLNMKSRLCPTKLHSQFSLKNVIFFLRLSLIIILLATLVSLKGKINKWPLKHTAHHWLPVDWCNTQVSGHHHCHHLILSLHAEFHVRLPSLALSTTHPHSNMSFHVILSPLCPHTSPLTHTAV